MKEFTTAAEEIVTEADREERIKALLAQGKTQQEAETEAGEADSYVEFTLDGRVMKAYTPTPAQLTFMLAALGRGQTKDSRFGSIVNIMMESMDEDDQDHLESRMLSRKRGVRLEIEQLEQIFEYLVGEWFDTPTRGQ